MHALICDFVFMRHTPCVTGYAMPFSLWLVSRQSERMEWTMLFQKRNRKKVGSFCDPRITTNSNALSQGGRATLRSFKYIDGIDRPFDQIKVVKMSGFPHLPVSPSFKIRNDTIFLLEK
jgi:hypothetical protein